MRDFAIFTLGFPRSHVRSYWQCVWGQFDLVLYADVFAQFPWRRALNVLMYHGAGTPARFLKKMRLRKHVADFDVVLTNGPHDRDLLLAIRPGERQPEIHDVGCPLLDALFDPPVSRAEYLQALGLDIGRKTVLYAPHWSLLDGAAAAHAEHFVADAIGALASLDLNVVVKLHRFSYTRVGGGGIDWERSLAAFVGDNIAVDLHVDDVTALAHADVLVTDDQSSRALNASLIGKPVIVYRPRSEDPTELTVRDYWSHLAPIARVAQDLPDLRAHVRAAATESAALADERRQVASRFFSHPGEATREAVRVVTELLRRQSNG